MNLNTEPFELSIGIYSLVETQLIIVSKEKHIRTKCSLPTGRLKLLDFCVRYQLRAEAAEKDPVVSHSIILLKKSRK